VHAEVDLGGGAVGRGGAFGHTLDVTFDRAHHLAREGAHRAAEFGRLRDHVVGVAGQDARDRQHGRIQRRHVARHDALQADRDLRGHQRRVDAGLGPRAVRPTAGDADVEERAAGHHRPALHVEAAHLQLGPVVHAEDGVAGETREQAVVDHRLGAAQAFLGRLEDEVHRAVETFRQRQVRGRAQQHGGVAVVAAGVHQPGVARAVGEAVAFQDGQRVHVGTQADASAAAAHASACPPRRCVPRRVSR
jgi:hypothetical protein